MASPYEVLTEHEILNKLEKSREHAGKFDYSKEFTGNGS